ncbi:B12-binding domain-containing radical SAM protein [Candidatus Pacearchaeota archaeon]|nr:B12-binding domain-containing radical SAM protein [Candidatus Pacearchaeota archaeon]
MKICLVHTGIGRSGFGIFCSREGDILENCMMNHGLALISAYAKKHGFKDINLIDLRTLNGWDDFKRKLLELKPMVIGLGGVSVDFGVTLKCAELVKWYNKECIVIVGGPHASIMPEDALKNGNIDYVITGEGEVSFTELLTRINNGRKPKERLVKCKRIELDKLEFADRELYPYKEILKNLRVPNLTPPTVTILVARGCMYNCSFCKPGEDYIFGSKVRTRSPKNVINELIKLREKYNFNSIMIHDDNLLQDREWIKEFCKLYKENDFDQEISCQARADLICKNEDLIKLFAETGLKMLLIGFESGNQRILNFLRKGTTVEQNIKAASICKKYGIKIWANYMFGVPTETREEVLDTVRMIRKIKPEHYSPAFFTPHPGSDLFDYCKENSISLIKDYEDYSRGTEGEKIKGVDYNFLKGAIKDSMKSRGFFIRVLNLLK